MSPRTQNHPTERASKSFMVKLVVPVFLGFDGYGNHHWHENQTQEVELFGWYDPQSLKLELVWGINLYTRAAMSPGWLDALMRDETWKKAVEKSIRAKLGLDAMSVATTIPAPSDLDDEDDNGQDEPYDNTHEYD